MADRLTQLQEATNQLADNFCNAIGILQQIAPPSQFPGFDRSNNTKPSSLECDETALLFAQLIAQTTKDVDTLIDSLPNEDSSPDLQVACLRRLEQENQESALVLERSVIEGERLLGQIHAALHEIAQHQLHCHALQSQHTS